MITEHTDNGWKLLHLHRSVPDFSRVDKKTIYYSQFDYLTICLCGHRFLS
ncbi:MULTISPECIES: nuclear transport factor 2 family protein [Anaerostipes]|uniref:Nuclear transport factor 2 family protein n=2 Tax=Anaerostipes TaxID=207244 RepID=A0ABV4DKR7_9FIRM|nr:MULTISPECIES: nuclear transport factor 2 family protein [Anaerostipes]